MQAEPVRPRPLIVHTQRAGERRDITAAVAELIWKSEVFDGLCHLVAPHRAATLSIGREGGPAAGVRNHVAIIVAGRRPFLAPGERIWLHEEAGPHRRKVVVRVEPAPRVRRQVDEGPPPVEFGSADGQG